MSHKCKALVINCLDFRFISDNIEFLNSLGLEKNFDLVALAGAALNLAAPKDAADRGLLLRQIQTSVELHRVAKVIIIDHEDCGAYPQFADPRAERKAHVTNLKLASQLITEKFSRVKVDLYYLRLPKAKETRVSYETII